MVGLAILSWSVAGAGVWLIADVATGLPHERAIRDVGVMARATTIYDAHDQPTFTLFKERRIEVPLSRMSPHLIRALIAVEDQRFYEHGGLDIVRVAGAAMGNLRDGWGTQGGSTLTQQLARQSFLTRDKTIQRKLKEVVVAARLEREFAKQQILEWYLNKVYFGNGLYGAEAAAIGYFGKRAADLDLPEAALLAGLVKAPAAYAPTVNLDRALARRRTTLDAMRRVGMIDAATARAADAHEVRLINGFGDGESSGAYFKEEVRKQLVAKFGGELVFEGGLRVFTTLDPELQRAAELEVERALADIEKRRQRGRRGNSPADEPPLQAALVALDPATGAVRAMVGGRSFDESRFNRVTQAMRQPGSAFKPFVYAAALERGYTPATIIRALDGPIRTLEGDWLPDDHTSSDQLTMRAAIRMSSNHAAVKTLQDIGIPAGVQIAERFGVGPVPGVPSLALGSGEVTLLSMTAAYGAFANGGMRPDPMLIRRVESADGQVLWAPSPRGERAVSESTAFLMTAMLSDVLNGGTGWQARRHGFSKPAAGKTGTTNDYRDAWFVGYTPHVVAGVWVGFDQPRTIVRQGYAATLAVPLWGRFMAAATKGDPATRFRQPSTIRQVTICRLSGKRATDACRNAGELEDGPARSMVLAEYFTRGTEPGDYCDWHGTHTAPGYVTAMRQDRDTEETAGTTGQAPDADPPAERRGFWRRIFGIGPASPPDAESPRPTQPSPRDRR